MRNLLRCRRGSAAFATVVALVPLIGVVALGGEAGSWYVTKQHAQNAADAAAYSGALRLACSIAGKIADTAQDYDLSRQAICGTERVLQRWRHLLSGLQLYLASDRYDTDRADRSADCEPIAFVPLLASNSQRTWQKCLVCPTVNIRAQAIAEVQNPKDLCMLGLGPTQ